MSGTEQSAIVIPCDDESEEKSVQWVVVANYCDDPHPHVLGTFSDRDDAEELLEDCGHRFREPHVDAWTLWKLAADEEPEIVSP